MNTDAIDKAFRDLVSKRNVHLKLGETSRTIINHRYKLKHGIPISLDTKLQLLQKSGWRQSEAKYTRADLVSLLKFYDKASAAAKAHGHAYIIEKWEVKR